MSRPSFLPFHRFISLLDFSSKVLFASFNPLWPFLSLPESPSQWLSFKPSCVGSRFTSRKTFRAPDEKNYWSVFPFYSPLLSFVLPSLARKVVPVPTGFGLLFSRRSNGLSCRRQGARIRVLRLPGYSLTYLIPPKAEHEISRIRPTTLLASV